MLGIRLQASRTKSLGPLPWIYEDAGTESEMTSNERTGGSQNRQEKDHCQPEMTQSSPESLRATILLPPTLPMLIHEFSISLEDLSEGLRVRISSKFLEDEEAGA